MRGRFFTIATLSICALATACGTSSPASAPDNGESAKTAQQIVADAANAMKSATGVHMTGSAPYQNGGTVSMDMQINPPGGVSGTMSLSGNSIQIVVTSTDIYLTASTGFWNSVTGTSAAGELLGGKCVLIPQSSSQAANFSQFTQAVDLNSLATSLSGTSGTLTKGSTSTINGQPVIQVTSSKGGSIYVATTGTPFPVRISSPSGQSGDLNFTNWNVSSPIATPSGTCLDLSQLQGASTPTPAGQ